MFTSSLLRPAAEPVEEKTTLVFGVLKEGKERPFLVGLVKMLDEAGVKPLCLYMHERVFLLALPIEHESVVDKVPDVLGDYIEEFMKLRLPATRFVILDLTGVLSAIEDIVQCAGPEVVVPLIFRLGYMYGKEIGNKMGFRTERTSEKLSAALEYLRVLGLFRRWSILHMSASKVEIVIEGASEKHFPHFLRGVFAGIVSTLFNKYYTCNLKSSRGDIMVFEVVPYK